MYSANPWSIENGRFSYFLAAAFVLAAGPAPAALLTTYSASASASFTLVDALFTDGSGSALGSVTISFLPDGLDDFPTDASGNAEADGTLTTGDGSIAATAFGGAGGPFGSSVATRDGRVYGFFENTSQKEVELIFDYVLDISAATTGTGSFVQAAAEFELQDFFGQTFFDRIDSFGGVTNVSGQESLIVPGLDTGFAFVTIGLAGEATALVPAPVPIDASLPLLGTGLVALGLVRRRGRRA